MVCVDHAEWSSYWSSVKEHFQNVAKARDTKTTSVPFTWGVRGIPAEKLFAFKSKRFVGWLVQFIRMNVSSSEDVMSVFKEAIADKGAQYTRFGKIVNADADEPMELDPQIIDWVLRNVVFIRQGMTPLDISNAYKDHKEEEYGLRNLYDITIGLSFEDLAEKMPTHARRNFISASVSDDEPEAHTPAPAQGAASAEDEEYDRGRN